MEISTMILDDLEQMKDTLYSDFDNFWSYNVLKQELENKNTTYVVAKENLKSELQNPFSTYIMAKLENKIVGFAGISVCFDEATLNNIVVKKSCRGRGIGGELLETLIEFCADLNMKSLTLEVNSLNTPAINLYEKFGFKNLGIRKKYYNNSQDAIIMTKYDI